MEVPFFVGRKIVMKKLKKIRVYCPKCGRMAGDCDRKSTINFVVKCKKCKKLVVYDPNTGRTELTEVPARTSSNGMRFY